MPLEASRRKSVLALAAVLALVGCKKDQRAPRAETPGIDAVARAVDAGAVRAVADGGAAAREVSADLPAPSEALGEVPEDIAKAVQLEVVAENLAKPVLLTFAPDDDRRRLFVVEQHKARIRVIEGGKVSKTAFFDLKGKVSTGNEQGLLGLAFHPKFADNRRLYVYTTDDDDDLHITEYQVSATDPDTVDLKTRREILFIEHPYANHNGGHLEFGPDGKLYTAIGDGGAAGDPKEAGQDPDQLLAKLLRIDVDAEKPKAEIVAMGLRNAWRFDFDATTGDLYIGDVGQDEWESVYAVASDAIDGANFGWSVAEGRHCYERERCDLSTFTPPVADYPHGVGCSVTGGAVYRGKALPGLDGVYFYADYCMGWIRSFRWRPDGIRQHWDWRPVLDPDAQITQVSSFGLDADGELYVLSLSGTIWKLSTR